MIRAHKFLATRDTCEAFLAGVGAKMSLEFVGSCKSLATK